MTRLAGGGSRIDRDAPAPLHLRRAGAAGLRGDTLASALLANGVRGAWRSAYHGRPRGIMGLGPEEPVALVQVTRDGISEPMLRAAEVELIQGLVARESLAGRGRLCRTRPPRTGQAPRALRRARRRRRGRRAARRPRPRPRAAPRVILAERDPRARRRRSPPAAELPGARRAPTARRRLRRRLRRARRSGDRLWHVRAPARDPRFRRRRAADRLRGQRPAGRDARRRRGRLRRALRGRARATAVLFAADDSGHAAAAAARAGRRRARRGGGRAATARWCCGTEGGDAADRGADPRRAAPCASVPVRPARSSRAAGTPSLELCTQAQGTLRWDAERACLPAGRAARPLGGRGRRDGTHDPAAGVAEGAAAGAAAADASGFPAGPDGHVPPAAAGDGPPAAALCAVEPEDGAGWDAHFVDLQRDATVARPPQGGRRRPALARARQALHDDRHRRRPGAHLRRPDAGRPRRADRRGDRRSVRPTTHRPPAVPVPFAAPRGPGPRRLSDPVRTTADPFLARRRTVPSSRTSGSGSGPGTTRAADEDMDAAVLRECRGRPRGRRRDGRLDARQDRRPGPRRRRVPEPALHDDFATLGVGRCRYGMICTADGMLFDDGVAMRLADDRYLVTTTTGNAAAVLDWFEEWLQTEWPELRVHCTSVTEQWATVAVVGPRSRDVLAALAPDLDVCRGELPLHGRPRRRTSPGSGRASAASPSPASSPTRSTCPRTRASRLGRR